MDTKGVVFAVLNHISMIYIYIYKPSFLRSNFGRHVFFLCKAVFVLGGWKSISCSIITEVVS